MQEPAWTEADTMALQAYFTACYEWLDSHEFFWRLWTRQDDVDFICAAYDADQPPAYAAAALTRRWRQFTVVM